MEVLFEKYRLLHISKVSKNKVVFNQTYYRLFRVDACILLLIWVPSFFLLITYNYLSGYQLLLLLLILLFGVFAERFRKYLAYGVIIFDKQTKTVTIERPFFGTKKVLLFDERNFLQQYNRMRNSVVGHKVYYTDKNRKYLLFTTNQVFNHNEIYYPIDMKEGKCSFKDGLGFKMIRDFMEGKVQLAHFEE